MTLHIDPARTDMITAFEAAPFGPYSPELQAILIQFRSQDRARQWVIVCLEGGKRYALTRLPAERFGAFDLAGAELFDSPAAAEIATFKRRWAAAIMHQETQS